MKTKPSTYVKKMGADSNMSWKKGTGNVKESRLNAGGDKKWGTGTKKKERMY